MLLKINSFEGKGSLCCALFFGSLTGSLSKKVNRAQLLLQLLLRPEYPLLDFCPVVGSFPARSLWCRHLPLPPDAKMVASSVPNLPKVCKETGGG